MTRQETHQIPVVVGSNIRSARQRKGLTQHELALAVDTQAFQIGRWEKGRHKPRDEMLAALAQALDLEISDFFSEPTEAAA